MVKYIDEFLNAYDLTYFKISKARLKTNYIFKYPTECNVTSFQFNKAVRFYCQKKKIRCGDVVHNGKIAFQFFKD